MQLRVVGRKRELGLLALLLSYLLIYIHRVMIAVLKPELETIANECGIDKLVFTSQIAAAYFYGYVAMQIPGGVLADVIGIKKYVSGSLAAMFCGTLLISLNSPVLIFLGRLTIGLGAASVFISLQRYIGIYYGKAAGGRLTGLALLVGNIGAIIATAPLRYMLDNLGYTVTILTISTFTIPLAVLTISQIPDIGLSSSTSLHHGFKEVINQLKSVVGKVHTWSLSIALFTFYGSTVAFQGYWGMDYYMYLVGVDKTKASSLLMLTAFGVAVSSLTLGYLSDKVLMKRKPLLIIGGVIQTVTWFTLCMISSGYSIITYSNAILTSLIVGVVSGFHIVIAPMARELYHPKYSGATFSFVNIFGFLGIAFYQALMPLMGGSFQGVLAIYTLSGIVAVVASLIARETI
jgi:MFS family permease